MQSDWPRAFLHITTFFKDMVFDSVKTIKVIIMLQLKPKNAHINGLNIL